MQTLLFGLSVALIGILVVFVGLVILIGCIKLIKFAAVEKKPKDVAAPAELAAPAESANAVEPASPVVADGTLPAETLAAITAAILSVWEEEGGFVVRHVRRVNNAPAWNLAGRDDQVYSRM